MLCFLPPLHLGVIKKCNFKFSAAAQAQQRGTRVGDRAANMIFKLLGGKGAF
jgi:hypothetical protein